MKYKSNVLVKYTYANTGLYGNDSKAIYPLNEDDKFKLLFTSIQAAQKTNDVKQINQCLNAFRTRLTRPFVYPECLGESQVTKVYHNVGYDSVDTYYYETHFARPTIESLIVNPSNRKILLNVIEEIAKCGEEIQGLFVSEIENSLKHTNFAGGKLFSWNQTMFDDINHSLTEIERYQQKTSPEKGEKIKKLVTNTRQFLTSNEIKNLHENTPTTKHKLNILKAKLTILDNLDEPCLATHHNKLYKIFNFIFSLFSKGNTLFITESQRKKYDIQADVFLTTFNR